MRFVKSRSGPKRIAGCEQQRDLFQPFHVVTARIGMRGGNARLTLAGFFQIIKSVSQLRYSQLFCEVTPCHRSSGVQ
jgi:hypothetical protein